MIHSTHLLRLSAVIARGSMRQAALALNISQPALSQSIRELEELVGTALFERTPRGLRVTPAGRQLGIHADIVASEIEKTSLTAAALRTGWQSHLSIGASASICASAIPTLAGTLLDEGLVSGLDVHEGVAASLIDRLARGALDVVVTYLWNIGCAVENVTFEQVGVSQIAVVCRREAAEAVRGQGTGALAAWRWVIMSKSIEMKQRFEDFFAASSIPRPPTVVETDSISFALRLLKEQDCFAFIPIGHAGILDRERFVALEIDGITWPRAVGVFSRRSAHPPPALRRVIELLRAHYAQPAEGGLPRLRLG